MSKTKRVRISNNSLNSYGSRVLTEGMDTAQYERNPVLLYMHERGNVVGYVKDVKVENDEVTGELVFDEATELSRQLKKQFEVGSIRMVSAGLDVLELSEEPEHLTEGQTAPTITKSKLFEVSLVDIGANDDAIVLRKDGKTITLGKDGANPLPLLRNNNKPKAKQMELKTIALQLGMPETADEAAVSAKLAELKKAESEVATLKKEAEKLTLANITAVVEQAISEKRINADKKEQFVNLGKKIGVEELKETFAAMSPQVKLSNVLGKPAGASPETVTYKKLSEVPADEVETLKASKPEEYKKLYKAEYGMDCEI